MKRLLNTVLIFMILMVFIFIGASPVMAFSSESMIVSQTVIENQGVSVVMVECLDRDSFLLNYKNVASNADYTNGPVPTFHIGKIQSVTV